MGTPVVVELEIACEAEVSGAGRVVIGEIHLLVFNGAPEPFGEDIVEGPPALIHAQLNVAR
jgi:hypothetical protein